MDATTFATQEGFATELVRNLRSRSYAVIELPIEASDAVNALLSETDVFFGASCAAERASLSHLPFAEDGTPTYRGTAETAARSMLFVRLTSGAPGVQPLPAALPSLPRASRLLHEVSLALLRAVAIGLNLMPDVLVDLADPMPNPPASERADGKELSSILTLFRYHSGSEDPCPEHVDYTLLTVAPFASAAGLDVLDLQDFAWRQPESEPPHVSSSATHAIVMVGEALEYVTRNRLSATTHRVSNVFGADGRLSCPYLLHARADASLIRLGAEARGNRPAENRDAGAEPLLARDFVKRSQLQKVSAVYT